MQEYHKIRERQKRNSAIMAVVATLGLHGGVAIFGAFNGMKYIYPPPEEQAIVLDFSMEEAKPIKPKTGKQPKAVEPDKTKDINLVQRSEAQLLGSRQNEAAEATVGDKGDVEVPEPPRKEINKRALFTSAKNAPNKDTLAAQTAAKVSDALKEGHAHGTTDQGREVGQPNARLAGRSPVNGYLPAPTYDVQNSGTVVIDIWVDNYGKVQKALVNNELTTVTDKNMWQAALNAAKKAYFNMTMDAPPLQQGTITYVFKLK